MSEEGKAAREDGSDSRRISLLAHVQELEAESRFLDAASLIAITLPTGTEELPKSHLTLARRAVELFARGGETRSAAQIMVRFPVDLALLVADECGQGVGLATAALAEFGAGGDDESVDMGEPCRQIRPWRGGRQQARTQLGGGIDLVDVEHPGGLGVEALALILVVGRAVALGVLVLCIALRLPTSNRAGHPFAELDDCRASFALAHLRAQFGELLVGGPDLMLELLGVGIDPQ